jgi:DNA repair protein RecO
MTIEGILLKKIPYQDRHIIGTLLTREGTQVPVLFYGGQGGGKSARPSQLQIGFLIEGKSQRQNKKRDEDKLETCREWQVKWAHEKISKDHKKFYHLCFFCELMTFYSLGEGQSLDNNDEHFSLLSNAIFNLENIEFKNEDYQKLIFYFLTRLIFHSGVYPDVNACAICGLELMGKKVMLEATMGGFKCESCADIHLKRSDENLLGLLVHVKNFTFKNYRDLPTIEKGLMIKTLHYLCDQFHLDYRKIQTLEYVN